MATSEAVDPSDLDALSVLDNYRDWIVSAFAPHLGARCIEFGAGIGNISGELHKHTRELHLVEPMGRLVDRLAQRFAGWPDVRVSAGTLEDCVVDTPADSFDSAVMVNVLEHIADDRAVLVDVCRILRPGGSLCLFVPALDALFSDYDRRVGHHRRYNLTGLRDCVERAGFTISEARYFDLLGTLSWYISMCVLKRRGISQGPARLYDRLAVPVGRCFESLISPPFGKNILLIAKKPMMGNV